MERQIVVIAEHFEGKVSPVTFETAAFGLKLQQAVGGALRVVILGDRIDEMARHIARSAKTAVTAVHAPGLASYTSEAYKGVLGEFLEKTGPAYVCIPHTSRGWDFAPPLAVRLHAACITDVHALIVTEGEPLFGRSLFNGKVVAHISPKTPSAVITVQPGRFRPVPPAAGADGQVTHRAVTFLHDRTRPLGVSASETADLGLKEANVVVAAGKGIGRKENLALLRQLARLFPKSAVAGSRTVCDLGWLPIKQQVGLTGATVSPQLYVACGISGASQHVAGMRGSDFVVAVNTDPNAAIFNVSDICLVEDLTTFIPTLLRLAEGRGAS